MYKLCVQSDPARHQLIILTVMTVFTPVRYMAVYTISGNSSNTCPAKINLIILLKVYN